MYHKLNGDSYMDTSPAVTTELEHMRRLAGLPGLTEGPPVNFKPVDMDDVSDISPKDRRDASARPGAAANVDPDAATFMPPAAASITNSIAARMAGDPNNIQDRTTAFSRALLQSPISVLSEISERLSTDNVSLAVSDRLSNIIRQFENNEHMKLGQLKAEDMTFVMTIVKNAIQHMTLVTNNADDDIAHSEQENDSLAQVNDPADDPIDSVDLDSIRLEHNLLKTAATSEVSENDSDLDWEQPCESCSGTGCKECDFTGHAELPDWDAKVTHDKMIAKQKVPCDMTEASETIDPMVCLQCNEASAQNEWDDNHNNCPKCNTSIQNNAHYNESILLSKFNRIESINAFRSLHNTLRALEK